MKKTYVETLPKQRFVAYDPEADALGLFRIDFSKPRPWYDGHQKKFATMWLVSEEDGEEPYGPCISMRFLSRLQTMSKTEAYKTLWHFERDICGVTGKKLSDFEVFETSVDALPDEATYGMTFRGKLVCNDLDQYDYSLYRACDDLDKYELCLIFAYEAGFDFKGVKA